MSGEPERGGGQAAKAGLATVGVVVFAVVCCGGGPLLVAIAGGAVLGAVLGIGAGVAVLLGLTALIVVRVRRRRVCDVAPPIVRDGAPHD